MEGASPVSETRTPGGSPRRHYIDWLRVLAVLLLFPFHVSRVFNRGEAFYVKSPHLSGTLGYVLNFILVWHMQLLFLLAGMSTYYALRKRSGGQYLSERVDRLSVPLGFHLWFILVLFLVSVVVLPLLLWGRTERGGRVMSAAARRLARPAWWLLPPFFIMVGNGLPELEVFRPFYYGVFFVLGWVVMFDDRFIDAAERRLACLAEGAYPIYILHQTVIVVIAFYLVGMPGPGWLELLVILAASVLGTFALYEVVRRVARLRFFFGMRRAAAA